MNIQEAIDEIEDYIGGNFEDAKFDAMGFTRFLRANLESYGSSERQAGAENAARVVMEAVESMASGHNDDAFVAKKLARSAAAQFMKKGE